MPKVSILMPVYNAEPYLKECLQSILKQTFADWELIAIDDFSEDSSSDTLEAFAQYDTRIKVYQNGSKGIIPALQKAFSHSCGQYITRMDADDLMPDNKIERLLHAAIIHNNHCITAKVEYFSENTLGEGYTRYAAWLNSLVDDQSHYDHIYKECVIPSPCWMMERKTITEARAFDSEIYPEDYDLVFRLYENKTPVYGIDEILHLWRDHGTRASRNDDHYKDQSFTKIKLHYFLKIDYNHLNKLYLWGAGTTAKDIARQLIAHSIDFQWISNNPNKIGHNIYGVMVEGEAPLLVVEDSQIIIAIKQKGFKEKYHEKIEKLGEKNEIYAFF